MVVEKALDDVQKVCQALLGVFNHLDKVFKSKMKNLNEV